MSVVINTNVDSIKIQNCLTSSTNKLSSSMERMSTGLKVNSAKDDAAGVIIAAKMKVQLSGNQIAQNNVQNGNALLSTAEGNIDVILENMTRIRDLTLQAKNGTYSQTEIDAMDAEVSQRIAEINRIASSSKYSSLQLFDGKLKDEGAILQVGANGEDNNTITADKKIFDKVTFSALTTVEAADFKLKDFERTGEGVTPAGVKSSFSSIISKLDVAIDNITTRKSLIGSAQNRLDSALNTLTTQYTNLSSAKSIITDADVASEASKYTQSSILQQVSTSLLAQANQAPSIALSLV